MHEHHILIEKKMLLLNGKIKHTARNSYHHLRKSWEIYRIDPQMSLFRALTAEEEAATGLILALKQRRYPNADRLNHYSHVHKSSFTPFLLSISAMLSEINFPTPQIILEKDGPPRIRIQVNLAPILHSDTPVFAEPDHPLNFLMTIDKDPSSSSKIFDKKMKQLAEAKNVKTILEYIKIESNIRNLILYASDSGIPSVEFKHELILERLRRVHVINCITIAVLQTPDHQLFVSQCLEALLRALTKIQEASPQIAES